MLKNLFNYFYNKKRQEKSHSDLIADLIKITQENNHSLNEIQQALPTLQRLIEDTSTNQQIIISQSPKTKNKIINFINIIMIPITFFTAYISIETYIQVKRMEFEILNTTWNIQQEDLFDELRITTEEDLDINNPLPPLEIYLTLGELNYLTGEMTLIDHKKKLILSLFVKVENFQLINIISPSKLYIWEFLNNKPSMKNFGLTIKPINEQSMEITGFNIINQEFDLKLPNTIKFTNTDRTSNITKKFTQNPIYYNYDIVVIDLICFSMNKIKSNYFSSKYFNGIENWTNYCLTPNHLLDHTQPESSNHSDQGYESHE